MERSEAPIDDADLIARAKAGDQYTVEQLVRRYQDLAFRVACLITGDIDEAQDAVQTAGRTSLTAPGGALIIDITGGMGGGIFEPGTTEIAAGTLVVWTNSSVEGHTIVIDGADERSGLIGPGAAYAVIFDEPGTYRYDCGPHPNMKGEIVVI